MKGVYTSRLEASVVHSICTQLENLGWIVDEKNSENNVTQQRAKTSEQKERLREKNEGRLKFPDFVLYEKGTTQPIGIIEAKRPGESLEQALKQAEERYARPLDVPIVFAYNDTFVVARHVASGRELKIDGEDVRQFIEQYLVLRFIKEGPEILSAPKHLHVSREELIRIFRKQANLLREAGLSAGLERFGAFSDILFLKLMDEFSEIQEQSGASSELPTHLRWSHFASMKPDEKFQYASNVVWNSMRERYGTIFNHSFPIKSAEIFHDIVEGISPLNFSGTDTDIKGDAFEYFLKNAYQGITIKDLGEYFTPRNIVRIMVSMVDPKYGETIYDPFCGTGGFLIEAFRYVKLRIKYTSEIENKLKNETVYGSEISSTARIAKMNMILFGDGHSNVVEEDSFENIKKEKYDIILTNPPYSQTTRYGNLYPLPSKDGDSIAIQHCLEALKPDGRAAILVKEDFLSQSGDIGGAREMLLKSAKDVSVISLPRRLFEPYTPTKTSIIYFQKNGKKESKSFYVVENVGHTFGARKQSTNQNDLPSILGMFRRGGDEEGKNITHAHIDKDDISRNNNSLWIYDYIEVLPNSDKHLQPLGEYIESSGERFKPRNYPDENFSILGVSNQNGIFMNEVLLGQGIKQTYIRVKKGDLVYNPHRVNVGSLGMVTEEFDGGIVSGVYVVFRPKFPEKIPSSYLFFLLKSASYLKIIRAYDTKHGAVRANLNYEQLSRIKISVPNAKKLEIFMQKYQENEKLQKMVIDNKRKLTEFVEK